MIERPADQSLKRTPFQIHILGRIDAGLLCIAQRFRPGYAQCNNQNVGPLCLYLLEQIMCFVAAQVQHQQGRAILLEDRLEPLGTIEVTHGGAGTQKRTRSPNEVRVLCIEKAGDGGDHAAATSSSKRTSGSRMWKLVP